ncbi:MAG: hypothetical protein Q8O61_03135, partial [Nocardioides sp.]|nr:hypothetical protein [Nocardioides sp.]
KKDASGNTLSCDGGSVTTVIAARPVAGANLDLAPVKTALNTAGAKSELRLTLSLPTTADNTFQGLSDAVKFTFDATQRAAQAR